MIAPQLFLCLMSEGHRPLILLLSCFLVWLCGSEAFAWSSSVWHIIYLVWRHIYNHILQLRRDFARMSQMLEKTDHWETLNIKTPPWHTEMGSGFCNNRCDCRLHTKLYFQVPGGSESKCQSLIKWVNIIVRQKKSSGFFFFFFVRGVLKYILSPCDFCFPTWTCRKFCPYSVSVFVLAARGKYRNRCHGFGVMPFERTLQSLLNDPSCAHTSWCCVWIKTWNLGSISFVLRLVYF